MTPFDRRARLASLLVAIAACTEAPMDPSTTRPPAPPLDAIALADDSLYTATPLSDLPADSGGGLYGDGVNSPPEWLQEAARAVSDSFLARLRPVVAVSSGTSNGALAFLELVDLVDPAWVHFIQGACGGGAIERWIDPAGHCYDAVAKKLERADLTASDIDVVFAEMIQSNRRVPTQEQYAAFVETVMLRWPSVRIVFLVSRPYCGYAGRQAAEPHCYTMAPAVREFVLSRLGRTDPIVAWGPYVWASFEPRSDGLFYVREDFGEDGDHPSPQGGQKMMSMWDDSLRVWDWTEWYDGAGMEPPPPPPPDDPPPDDPPPDDPPPDDPPPDDPPADPILLEVAGRHDGASFWADLTWSGAVGESVDVYRAGKVRATTENDGEWADEVGSSLPDRDFAYTVCAAGSTIACSEPVTATFPPPADPPPADPPPDDPPPDDPPPAPILLEASGRFDGASYWADLAWSGAGGEWVDVLRAGKVWATTENDGEWADEVGPQPPDRDVPYTVCETGSATACSEAVTPLFPAPEPPPADPPPDFALEVATRSEDGFYFVDLTWNPSGAELVDVVRQGRLRDTTEDDGQWTDELGRTLPGRSVHYQVCVTGSSTACSPEVPAEW